jgi:hypothetical protein
MLDFFGEMFYNRSFSCRPAQNGSTRCDLNPLIEPHLPSHVTAM